MPFYPSRSEAIEDLKKKPLKDLTLHQEIDLLYGKIYALECLLDNKQDKKPIMFVGNRKTYRCGHERTTENSYVFTSTRCKCCHLAKINAKRQKQNGKSNRTTKNLGPE